MTRRLSIAYVVPGHDLVPSAGPTRNVLSLAEALSAHADVTVAFRRIADGARLDGPYRAVAIQPGPCPADRRDDAALRGTSVRELLGYLRTLRAFVGSLAPSVDLVLEKSWLFSGYVSERCRRQGTPSAVVENIVRVPASDGGGLGRRTRHELAQALVGRWLRRAPLVIAETEVLRRALIARLGLAAERIAVVGLGIDRERFRPRDRAAARRALGLDGRKTLLVYVGVLDATHDLRPLLRALHAVNAEGVELHVVGDGAERETFESLARSGPARVVFHGRVDHDAVPGYIAACDLFVAPYDRGSFPGGEVAYSTLKIPESLASGRPVASVASGNVLELIEDGTTGFLVAGDDASWTRLFSALPDRERLDAMGRAAAERGAPSWNDVARAYLDACRPLVESRRDAR